MSIHTVRNEHGEILGTEVIHPPDPADMVDQYERWLEMDEPDECGECGEWVDEGESYCPECAYVLSEIIRQEHAKDGGQ